MQKYLNKIAIELDLCALRSDDVVRVFCFLNEMQSIHSTDQSMSIYYKQLNRSVHSHPLTRLN